MSTLTLAMSILKTRVHGVFYGWWLVAVGVLILAVVIGPVFQGVGTFFVALERDFGWSRTMLSGAFALGRVEGGLGPVEGYLTDRFGARRVMLLGFAVLGLGFLLFSRLSSPVTFYGYFLVIVVGAAFAGFLPLTTTVNHWFVQRRATAMGITMMGLSAGGLMVPGLAWSIDTFGWQRTALGMGIMIWLLAVPLVLMIRNRPEEYGQLPDGGRGQAVASDPGTAEAGDPQGVGAPVDFTVGEALRTLAFWAISLAHGFSAMAVVALAVHAVAHLTDQGLSFQMASNVVGLYFAIGLVFHVVGGFAGDRMEKRYATFLFIAVQSFGVFVLAFAQNILMALAFAVLFGIGFGGRVPLLMDIRGDYFGRKAYAMLLGISLVPMNVALFGAPLFAGFMYDATGTYLGAFVILAVLNLLGGTLVLTAKKPALRRRGYTG